MTGKRRGRSAAGKAARVEPDSEPEHDDFGSNEDVPIPGSPTPVIPLHLKPASDMKNKRMRFSSADEEEGNGEGSSAQGHRRKKRAGSVIDLDAESDHSIAGDNDEASRLSAERNQHPQPSSNSGVRLGTPAGLSSRDESPSLGQRPRMQSESGAVAGSSRQVHDDVGHVLEGPRNNNDDEDNDDVGRQHAGHERAPPRNAWTILQSLSGGVLQIFNFDPQRLLRNAPNDPAPVVALDDLSAAAIGNCVRILVAERDRLRAEHSTMKATITRLGHNVFHPEATLELQVSVRLAAIERIVRRSELGHANVEAKRAASIRDLYSAAVPSPDVAPDEADDDQDEPDEQQAPPNRHVGNPMNRAEEAEVAKQDHEAMAAKAKDTARQLRAASEALAAAERRLEEFTDNTKARLKSLETQIVYIGRCLDAVQAFST